MSTVLAGRSLVNKTAMQLHAIKTLHRNRNPLKHIRRSSKILGHLRQTHKIIIIIKRQCTVTWLESLQWRRRMPRRSTIILLLVLLLLFY